MNDSLNTPIKRRTVAKGIAWTVPAVTVAGTAPAFAASSGEVIFTYQVACKSAGASCDKDPYWINKGYSVRFWVCNTSPFEVAVTLPPQMAGQIAGEDVVFDVGLVGEYTGLTFILPAGSPSSPACQVVDIKAEYDTSGNTPVWASGTATWTSTDPSIDVSGTSEISFYADDTPVCEYPGAGESPNGCTFPPESEPEAEILGGGRLPETSCSYYEAGAANTFFGVHLQLTNTDQGRAIRLLTSTITYSLEPTLGNVEYVGPFTDIFRPRRVQGLLVRRGGQ